LGAKSSIVFANHPGQASTTKKGAAVKHLFTPLAHKLIGFSGHQNSTLQQQLQARRQEIDAHF
jgi:hypothetical protein